MGVITMDDKKVFPEDFALKLFSEAEQMSMRRFQFLSAVEGAGLAGWYLLCNDGHPWMATTMIVVATAIGILLWWLAEYDRADARRYRALLEKIYPWWRNREGGDRPWGLRGQDILRYVGAGLLALNLTIIAYTLGCGCP